MPNIWRVASALIESAALYSVISLVLFIAFFASPEVGYPACANIFTVLIVRASSPKGSSAIANESVAYVIGFHILLCRHTGRSSFFPARRDERFTVGIRKGNDV